LINQVSQRQHAHSRSLVHRDIKPGNILIARNGQTLSISSRFGVAKHYTNAGFSDYAPGDARSPPTTPEQFLNS
jgi:serine/threonine protein kinase